MDVRLKRKKKRNEEAAAARGDRRGPIGTSALAPRGCPEED